MNWTNRINKTIRLTSPSGKKFEAFWIGSPRSAERKVGLFDYPNLRGTFAQDLDASSARYPITFYFSGKDHDNDAREFFEAAGAERGIWDVTHPMHGFLGLQLLSVTENDQPVTEGNVTEFSTEWIEPIDPSTLLTAAQLAAYLGKAVREYDALAANQFADRVNLNNPRDQFSLSSALSKISGAVDVVLGPLSALSDTIFNTVNEVQNFISAVLFQTITQPLALAAQFQQILQLPALATADAKSRLDYYENMITEIFNLKTDEDNINEAFAKELAYSSIISVHATIATTSEIPTKTGTIDSIDRIKAAHYAMIADMENDQELFANARIDQKYIAQETTRGQADELNAASLKYLLINFFDAKIEKRFVLDRPRSPWEITVSEYGSLGEDDENYQLFIDSNKLKGNKILILPSGEEVVIYA